MSEGPYIEFRYEDLVRMEQNGQRPRGYVADVMKSARKSFGTVYMTLDAYKGLCAKYSSQPNTARLERNNRSRIIVPRKAPKQVLGPTGLPLATSCCGRSKSLQTAA